MGLFLKLCRRIGFLLKRKQLARDLEEEMRFHLEMKARAKRQEGMAPEEAGAAAQRSFGNACLMQEASREAWGFGWLDRLAQDVRYGLRSFARNPGFSAVAVAALALGIGVNTAIFSVVDAVVLRPLPYPEPDRILAIWEYNVKARARRIEPSGPLFAPGGGHAALFRHISPLMPLSLDLAGVPQPERTRGAGVSADFFALLGARPALGRPFLPSEENAAAGPVVVIGHSLWQRQFGSDPGVLGRTVKLDNAPYTIIGVMPPGFQNPIYNEVSVWLPASVEQGTQWLARLEDGRGVAEAAAQLETARRARDGADWRVRVFPLRDRVVGDYRTELFVLLACAGFVLLAACTNVANLLLARGTARLREVSLRAALGAGRARLVRQLMTESLLLAAIGCALALPLAFWTLRALIAIAPAEIPRFEAIGINVRVLGFGVGLAIVTGILFGAAPALRLTRIDLSRAMQGARGGAAGAERGRARNLLVAAEVALSLLLLIGAGLMVRSFLRLRPAHPGFDPSNKLTMMLKLARWKYPDPGSQAVFCRRLIERIRLLPAAAGVAATDYLPLSGNVSVIEAKAPGRERTPVNYRAITPDYFRVMGIPLRKGRVFTDADDGRGRVAIVSERMAEQFWPGEEPLGKNFSAEYLRGDYEVVGVAGDVRFRGVSLRLMPEFYVPFAQKPGPTITLIVSARSRPMELAAAIRGQIGSVDRDQTVSSVATLEQIVFGSVAMQRFYMVLMAGFAVVALALAAVGIYGVTGYTVTRRMNELGVRIALGASSRQILWPVLRQGLAPVGVGVMIGWLASLGLTRFLASLLYGLSPTDPVAISAVVLLLTAVAALASYIPARRALTIDPVVTLRYE